jgi:hypothetical protein
MNNKRMSHRIFYVVSFITISILLYLFALNGRYVKLHDIYILDKWKGRIVLMGSDELPLIK